MDKLTHLIDRLRNKQEDVAEVKDRGDTKIKPRKSPIYKKWWFWLIVVAIVAGLYFRGNGSDESVETVTPRSGSISQVVTATGPVVSAEEASLSFEKSGQVGSVSVKVGDKVRAGQALVSLRDPGSSAKVKEAYASVLREKAQLSDILSGSSEGEISKSNTALKNSETELALIESQMQDIVSKSHFTFVDILQNKITSIYTYDGSKYKISFGVCDQSSQQSLETARGNFGLMVDDVVTTPEVALDNLKNLDRHLAGLSALLTQSCVVNDANYDKYRLAVSGARNAISSVVTEINQKVLQKVQAQSAISRAKADLALTVEGPDKDKVALQEALVLQAQARYEDALATSRKNVIYAPFSGTISEVSVEVGEIAQVGKEAVGMILDSEFQIEAKLSEVDVAKIAMGNNATVTLDAFGKERVFTGKVSRIDPKSIVDGSTSRYRVIVTFDEKYKDIKAGMTANLNILARTVDDALIVPAKYVTVKSGGGLVTVQRGEDSEEVIVTLGIRGESGDIEIKSGITKDDVLLPRVGK